VFGLLGRYENFPENVHGVAHLEHQNSAKEAQKAIICTFHRLNQETFDLSVLNPYLKQKCEVGFEFGVADGACFNFLNPKELARCLKSVDETEMECLDFFFAVRYHRVRDGGERLPLKFDYCVLRFSFKEGGLELRIRHERGTQRVPLDELTEFLVKQMNVELSQRRLTPLFFGVFKKVSI
jgi:hypothetical protein